MHGHQPQTTGEQDEWMQLKKIFTLSDDLVCVAGTDGYFKKVNPAFSRLLGWEESFLLQTSYLELVHLEDQERTRQEMHKLAAGMHTVGFLHRFRKSDGDYSWLQWTAVPEAATGDIFAIARDVTDQKNRELQLTDSENKFRAFFENSQGLMCLHDLEGKFIEVNNASAVSLGYSMEELTGKSLFDVVPSRYHTALNHYLDNIRRKGKASGIMYTVHQNGSERIWLYNNILAQKQEGEYYIIGNALDITLRHRLETDLKRTKELMEQTNKVARVGGWELNVETGDLYWSDVTREIHEVPKSYQPDLANAVLFYREEDRERLQSAIAAAMQTGTPWNLELRLISAQGRERWVRAIGNAEFSGDKCIRLMGTLQDIDERKRTAIEIQNSRNLLENILQSASEVSIIATTAEGIITIFNKGAEKLLGYTAEEMIGRNSPAILHEPEELKTRSRELSREYGMPIEGFRIFVHEAEITGSDQRIWTYIRKDGSRLTVSLVVTTVRDVQQNIIGYLGIATDITERQKAAQELTIQKARLSSFVEHAPAAVAMFDPQLRYIAYSNRWLEDYQLTGQNLIGRTHYEVFPNVSDEWKAIHQRCLAGAIEKNEEDVWRPEGWDHDQYLRWEVRPWFQYDGSIGGIMMLTQDITESCLQREELRKAKMLAEQASIAKSEFLANMSHEIRTPLNGVIGFTDLVLRTKLSETQYQYLSIVNQSANALLSIINDILDFSKIEAGKLELDIDRFDLYEMSSQASDITAYQAQRKGLEMLLNVSTSLPRYIWADAVRLKQVLVNLLGNATKFTEKGEIELRISPIGERTADGHQVIRFEVRDTGIGISPENQSKIFDAFLQEDVSTTKKYGGTGLGLTISNKLLALMGSRLQLQSHIGGGSSFFFEVSLRTEDGLPRVVQDISFLEKALIVDDNTNNCTILHDMLQIKGIAADKAHNGLGALQLLLEGNRYDVIIMDYHMPYMDGLETIRKIKQDLGAPYSELPIVFLHSSSDDEKIISICEELGVRKRLVKPIKMQELYEVLESLHQDQGRGQVQQEEKQAQTNSVDILIVEDNKINLLLAQTILQRAVPDARIREAGNGLEALRQCEAALPDLILMDIQMPVMNGYETTRKIRERYPDHYLPIIALTAGNVKGEREKCLDAGVDDFVTKPYTEEIILAVLEKWRPSADKQAAQECIPSMHFDVSVLKKYLGEEGNEDSPFVDEVLTVTLAELQKFSDSIRALELPYDLQAIKAIGHKMRGSASFVGLLPLSEKGDVLDHLETQATQAEIAALLQEALAELRCCMEVISAYLQRPH